jgi:predicted DNA-binding transcriptional regulator
MKPQIDLALDEKFLIAVRLAIQPHVGEDNRISRAALSAKVHKSDRIVRDAVSELQRRGELIFSDTDEGGYFYLGDNPNPAIHYINQEYHRSNEIREKAKALENALKATRGIMAGQGRFF